MRIKRAIIIVLTAVALLFLSLVGGVIWAVKNPQKAFVFAEKYILPADLSIKWEGMDFEAKRITWLHWNIDWTAKKLTVQKGDPRIFVPVDEASVRFDAHAFAPGPWFSFREVKAAVGEAASFTSSGEVSNEKGELSPFEQLQSYLGYLKTGSNWLSMETIDLRVPKFALVSADGASTSYFGAKVFKPLQQKDGQTRAAGFEGQFESGEIKLAAQGWVDANLLESPSPFLALTAEGSGKAWKTKTQIQGFFQNDAAKFEGSGQVEAGEGGQSIKGAPKFTLTMNPGEALLKLETSAWGLPGPVVKLDKAQAELHMPFDKGFALSERPATFKIWSAVDLFFIDKDMRPPLEKSCRCKIPEKLVVTYDGRIWLDPVLGSPQTRTTAVDSKLSVEGVDNKLVTVNLNAHLKILKQAEQWFLEPRMDSSITVQSFQGLRQFLDARNVMIPAPLDILDGKIKITAQGDVDHDEKLIRSSVDIKVDLSSPNQRVLLDTTVRLDLTRDFKALDVLVQTLIQEVRVELPPIDPIRGIPSLKTDSRLLFQPEKKTKSNFKLRVFFDVKTGSPGGLKLTSRLAEPYVPITIDINNANKGESSGSVRLEPFAISYLRRKVHVERLQVTLSENEDGDFPIGGRLRLDQTAYKIYVDLAGTLDAPIVNLNSEPFLPRSDIISVLLFDRVNDQLVSGDADTAGGFEAALADRAIGLFGLWAFATTPIRSFSYNAVTKVYTATVQLADGLTAGVGTNWERAAHLEVRKRVSRRWVLTASWSPNNEREQVGKLVLQWEKRF